VKYLLAEKTATSYHFLIWTDETKKLENGTPDPFFVKEFEWGLTPPEGQTEANYITSIKREIELLVAPAPAPVPLEGFM
jgi:hypothetical protein